MLGVAGPGRTLWGAGRQEAPACMSLPWKPGGHTMSACWKGSGRAQIWVVPVCRGMLRWATAAMDAAEGWQSAEW